jgi:predicted metalloprotease with PDZ domain
MKVGGSFSKWSVFLIVTLAPCASVWAQQPTYLVPVEMQNQWLRGSVEVAEHGNDGVIGVNGIGTDQGYKVETIVSGGPAAKAGVAPGDIITSIDGASVKGIDTVEALKLIAHKQAGESVNLTISRNGETKTLGVVVDARNHMLANDPQWQKESTFPPGVAQFIFGGSAAITAGLF